MKYMVGIPCLYGVGHTVDAVNSVVKENNTELLLIDNGAEREVSEALVKFSVYNKNVGIIRNQENIYVNPAWNQIIKHFISSESDYLLIMNSDLILHKDWRLSLDGWFEKNSEVIPVPVISTDKRILEDTCKYLSEPEEITEGPAGVLIILNKVQARLIYPIPETIKVWFGDNWIYEGLRAHGYKTIILKNLLTYHSGSQNVSKVKGVSEIIEQDKIAWESLK